MNKLSEELTEIADLMLDVGDRLEDEGDRVFLGSTNDADRIRELARRLEGLAARSEALSSPGACREEVETLLVEHVRKINRVVAAGMHEGGAIREAADAILSLLSSPGGQGNSSSGAESAADRGPCPSAPPTQHSAGGEG